MLKQRNSTLDEFIGCLSNFNIKGIMSLPRLVSLFMYLVFPPQSPVCQCGNEEAVSLVFLSLTKLV